MNNRLDPPSMLGYILHQILWCPYFVGLDLVMRQHGPCRFSKNMSLPRCFDALHLVNEVDALVQPEAF
jgi:hypothetical protein